MPVHWLGARPLLALAHPEMPEKENELAALAQEILSRYCAQNGRASESELSLAGFAARLQTVVARRGLPRPLAENETGNPGELPERECLPLVEEVLGPAIGDDRVFFATPLRQLIKACFHEEFKTCRDSFR